MSGWSEYGEGSAPDPRSRLPQIRRTIMQKMKQLCLASAAFLLALPLAAQQTVRVPLYDSYGPVLVAPGASLRVCANNQFGTSTFQARIYFFDALNTRAVL